MSDFILPAGFADKYGPWAVIAGGSEGVGESFAHMLAAAGINLVLLAHRQGPLDQLAQHFSKGMCERGRGGLPVPGTGRHQNTESRPCEL